eukprot:scaffold965_cov120-Isochrysis_galbana.AAC.1
MSLIRLCSVPPSVSCLWARGMWHVHVLCCSSCASPGRQGRVRCSIGRKLARGVLRGGSETCACDDGHPRALERTLCRRAESGVQQSSRRTF